MTIYPAEKNDSGQYQAKLDHIVRIGYTQLRILRVNLAAAEGIELDRMAGYASGSKSWDEVDTALKPFLDHPDDEGTLTPRECFDVYPTMERILTGWRDDPGCVVPEVIISLGLEVVEAMKKCSTSGWELMFA